MDLYRTLPGDHSVRVLYLEPGQGDEPLVGHLKTIFSLAETASKANADSPRDGQHATSFEAISYVWGSNTMDHTILLDGNTHHITANLADALRQCRLPDRRRALWADSICINQKDLKEKGHQVALMGRIYAASQCTLICLGADQGDQGHARDAAAALSDINDMMREVFRRPDFSWERGSFPWTLPDDALLRDPRWESLGVLTKQPWFCRGWVIQEAVLARDARILWAGLEIPLLDLLRAAKWVSQRVFTHRLVTNKIAHSSWPSRIPRLLHQTFFQKSQAEARSLYLDERAVNGFKVLEALHDARWLDIGDPRDRIYAFMALRFIGHPMPTLQPNYEQSHLEVYRDFAVEYLGQNSDLDILCFVSHVEETLQNPRISSWVPQWDYLGWGGGFRLAFGPRFGFSRADSSSHAVRWEADAVRPPLQVRCVVLDSVTFASATLTREAPLEEIAAIWTQSLEAPSAPPPRDEADATYRSLAIVEALSASYVWGSSQQEWAHAQRSYASILTGGGGGGGGDSYVPASARWCHASSMHVASGARLFLLGRGNYGLGPGVLEGDVCACVFGTSSPFVLRRVPGAEGASCPAARYRLVGPAYVVSRTTDDSGIPVGLNKTAEWDDWEAFRGQEEWADWGREVQVEDILLV